MEVILIKRVVGLGDKDDLVEVKNGYGRNYLIPNGFAMIANDSNKKILANNLKFKDKREATIISEYEEIAKVLKSKPVKIGAKTGSTDKIFGSITTYQIVEAVKDQLGVEIDRKKVSIDGDEIKKTGEYKVNVDLHEKVPASFTIDVVSE